MNRLNEKHQQAMDLAEQAFAARRRSDLETARSFAYRAYLLEKQAAEQSQTEPTRSVLHRSAATLALDCGEYGEAQRLVTTALAGNPPKPIADELREVLNAISKENTTMPEVDADEFADIEVAVRFHPADTAAAELVKQCFADEEIRVSSAFTGTETVTVVVSATRKAIGKLLEFFAQYRQSYKNAIVKIGPKEISLQGYSIEEVKGFFESEAIQTTLKEMKQR